MWYRSLNDLGKKVCALYPFICELCFEVGHFNFQCSGHNNSPLIQWVLQVYIVITRSLIINMMNLHYFWGVKSYQEKPVDMSAFGMNSVMHGCHLYCVDNCHKNTYIQNIIKYEIYQNMTGLICILFLLMKRRNPPKFLLLSLTINQGMWRIFLSSLSLLKRRRKRRRGGVKGGRKRYFP